jgi:hypothetical protein
MRGEGARFDGTVVTLVSVLAFAASRPHAEHEATQAEHQATDHDADPKYVRFVAHCFIIASMGPT